MKQSYSVEIKGYWRESKTLYIPEHDGIYFVYVGTYNQKTDKVGLKKLIYIGESENVRTRINNHEKWDVWKNHLQYGEILCFSTGATTKDRNRIEAAYIFKHKPPVNVDFKYSFPFDETRVVSSGETEFLNTNFSVYRT